MNLSDFFDGDRCIKFQSGLEGQTVENDIVIIGDRAGPEINPTNLCHEMAHFVEIDIARMKMRGWGLRYPEVWVIDKFCIEPRTIQITEREMRVAALQANLQAHFGLSDDDAEVVRSFAWLPDFLLVPLEDGSKAYCGENHGLSYPEIQASQLRWIENQVKQLRKTLTLDYFVAEWNIRSFA